MPQKRIAYRTCGCAAAPDVIRPSITATAATTAMVLILSGNGPCISQAYARIQTGIHTCLRVLKVF
jgi:hypothetical protein